MSGSRDETLRLWDVESNQSIAASMKGHLGAVRSVAFSPDGTRIVSGSDDYEFDSPATRIYWVRLWDAKSEPAHRRADEGHDYEVMSVAFSPDGTRIVG